MARTRNRIKLRHDKLKRETTVATEKCARLMARSGWQRVDPQPAKAEPAPKAAPKGDAAVSA